MSGSVHASKWARGMTYAAGENDDLLGTLVEMDDIDYTDTDRPFLSRAKVKLRYVKNDSGGALLPGQLVVYKTGYGLKRIVDQCATSAEIPVGVVDEYLPAAGVPDGYNFLMVVDGPTKLINEASGSIVEFAMVKAGGTTEGRAEANASTPLARDVGWALEATSTAAAKFRHFLRLPNGG